MMFVLLLPHQQLVGKLTTSFWNSWEGYLNNLLITTSKNLFSNHKILTLYVNRALFNLTQCDLSGAWFKVEPDDSPKRLE